MIQILFSKPTMSPERTAERGRLAHYMRTGHLRPNPSLCKHGVDIHGEESCQICADPVWARTCPRCSAQNSEALTMDGFLCHECKRVYVIEGKTKYFDKEEQ